MKILWISAHPEQRSLNGRLMTEGLRVLTELGHERRVSDLYAMDWKPIVDAGDFGGASRERLFIGREQERAYGSGELSEDIRAEQEKLAWADVVVFQFPLWWLGPPAILKGWFDRVLVQGFGFGIKDPEGQALRYGDGGLAGKRALVVTSIGARESSFGPRGIHGPLEEVLFPLLHGTFWYTGMAALPPFAVYGADRLTAAGFSRATADLRERLRTLDTTEPLPFRHENGGEYDEDLTLRPDVAAGLTGVGVHRAQDGRAHR
ncbi:NAD(P)H-dependent oxidoreductase [Streptomyces kanamyceticus]|uniref:Flavodoxin family protein n=1 Tax=Streptomyces kanamyceticus TaxID=1967 RepID=Q1EQD8_STRKN|nr:NAD(P)H-dependent oxidoreductase [Streptomyces kanamyceticus]QEU90603.1 flavodoxin family protein [Streptomyces kanamyceticus]BAE95582.1 putative NAD(P)H quinone reductase [Streptomyces kanamyceticus]